MRLTKDEKRLHKQFVECGFEAKKWIRKCKFLLPKIYTHQIWRKKGFSSINEYAAKLAGLSEWQVRDALRVLKNIEDKPALKELALRHGLSRVRPVASIATSESQAFWAEKANEMSHHTLKTYVREFKASKIGGAPNSLGKKVQITLKINKNLIEKLKQHGDVNELLETFIEGLESKQNKAKKKKNQAQLARNLAIYPLKSKNMS